MRHSIFLYLVYKNLAKPRKLHFVRFRVLDEAESIILGDELSVSGINSVLRRIMEQNSSEADSSVSTS